MPKTANRSLISCGFSLTRESGTAAGGKPARRATAISVNEPMKTITYQWHANDSPHVFSLVHVEGTGGRPFSFGEGNGQRAIEVSSFYMATVPVSQALWKHLLGPEDNPSIQRGDLRPVENVSWNQLTARDGFLDKLNASGVLAVAAEAAACKDELRFRLPSETEWEYAARGGPHWKDGFQFSGGNDIEPVAWYQNNTGDQMHDVALKAPNQLGLYDMSGNAWEWCQDCYTSDIRQIPADGTAFLSGTGRRVLRGGCFHNWAIHCTVSKRYEIAQKFHDGCIGFRLVLAPRPRRP